MLNINLKRILSKRPRVSTKDYDDSFKRKQQLRSFNTVTGFTFIN